MLSLLLLGVASLTGAAPSAKLTSCAKPPAFFFAGDSTTAVNGGWGDGLLSTVIQPATGLNVGRSGATTASFRADGSWKNVTDHMTQYIADYDVYVTISVGRHILVVPRRVLRAN